MLIFLSLFLLTSCGSTTVLLVNFKNDAVGSAPASAQPTGTVSINNGSGSIVVVNAPAAGMPVNKWGRIIHHTAPSPETTLTGNLTRVGPGKYAFLCSMHIPSGAGVVTVQFETVNSSGSFFHLDFMPENNIRIDDGSTRFGTFPRDANFVLAVNLNITSTTTTIETTLLGTGASGNQTTNLTGGAASAARQFGAVKFWVGFQHNATFFVDDILVTRKN